MNRPKKISPDAVVIDQLGGPAQLAKRLGLSGVNAVQRVWNWRQRGIPARVLLDHADVFAKACSSAAAASTIAGGANAE